MDKWLLIPVFAQILLTSVVMIIMGRRRILAAKNKHINVTAFQTMDLSGAAPQVIATGRNFDNQFQMPLLYLFSVLFTLQLGLADITFLVLGCLFVALRYWHTVIHIGSNHLRSRFQVFLLGCVVLWVIWVRLLILVFI